MKKFKLPVIMIIMTLGFIKNSPAHSRTSGLYLTYNDFVNHKLSYVSDGSQEIRIVYHEFLGGKNVTVISDGKKLVLPKDQVFGYRDGSKDYRFYRNTAYQIVDSNGFYLYTADKLVLQTKGMKPTKVFYFSTKADNELLALTEQNIDKVFIVNYKFRNHVRAQFRSDEELDQYDNAINEFKIKEVYTESTR